MSVVFIGADTTSDGFDDMWSDPDGIEPFIIEDVGEGAGLVMELFDQGLVGAQLAERRQITAGENLAEGPGYGPFVYIVDIVGIDKAA